MPGTSSSWQTPRRGLELLEGSRTATETEENGKENEKERHVNGEAEDEEEESTFIIDEVGPFQANAKLAEKTKEEEEEAEGEESPVMTDGGDAEYDEAWVLLSSSAEAMEEERRNPDSAAVTPRRRKKSSNRKKKNKQKENNGATPAPDATVATTAQSKTVKKLSDRALARRSASDPPPQEHSSSTASSPRQSQQPQQQPAQQQSQRAPLARSTSGSSIPSASTSTSSSTAAAALSAATAFLVGESTNSNNTNNNNNTPRKNRSSTDPNVNIVLNAPGLTKSPSSDDAPVYYHPPQQQQAKTGELSLPSKEQQQQQPKLQKSYSSLLPSTSSSSSSAPLFTVQNDASLLYLCCGYWIKDERDELRKKFHPQSLLGGEEVIARACNVSLLSKADSYWPMRRGSLFITNYQLIFKKKALEVKIPIMNIRQLSKKSLPHSEHMKIYMHDMRALKLTFDKRATITITKFTTEYIPKSVLQAMQQSNFQNLSSSSSSSLSSSSAAVPNISTTPATNSADPSSTLSPTSSSSSVSPSSSVSASKQDESTAAQQNISPLSAQSEEENNNETISTTDIVPSPSAGSSSSSGSTTSTLLTNFLGTTNTTSFSMNNYFKPKKRKSKRMALLRRGQREDEGMEAVEKKEVTQMKVSDLFCDYVQSYLDLEKAKQLFAFSFVMRLPQCLMEEERGFCPQQRAKGSCDHGAPNLKDKIVDGWRLYDPWRDFNRMGIPNEEWRITELNRQYELCDTYPRVLCIPRAITPQELITISRFRSKGRIPALCWMHPLNKAVLCRCSQPLVGLGKRLHEDELLLRYIRKSNSKSHYLHIIDARPRANALANKSKGGGYETTTDNDNIHISFMRIENIHKVRESFNGVFAMLKDGKKMEEDEGGGHWLSLLENSQWLRHIRMLLSAASRIAQLLERGECVLTHCSDGWDRTPQLTSLSQIMLDPYYRTLEGFIVVIEKEWLSFGHKFAERCGHQQGKSPPSERSPVFIQFLDCVWQIMQQFPYSFEFNEQLLVTLADEVYNCRFGTFLYNSEKERLKDNDTPRQTVSVWTWIYVHKQSFLNPFYVKNLHSRPSSSFTTTSLSDHANNNNNNTEQCSSDSDSDDEFMTELLSNKQERNPTVLLPCFSLKKLRLWDSFFLRWDTLCHPRYSGRKEDLFLEMKRQLKKQKQKIKSLEAQLLQFDDENAPLMASSSTSRRRYRQRTNENDHNDDDGTDNTERSDEAEDREREGEDSSSMSTSWPPSTEERISSSSLSKSKRVKKRASSIFGESRDDLELLTKLIAANNSESTTSSLSSSSSAIKTPIKRLSGKNLSASTEASNPSSEDSLATKQTDLGPLGGTSADNTETDDDTVFPAASSLSSTLPSSMSSSSLSSSSSSASAASLSSTNASTSTVAPTMTPTKLRPAAFSSSNKKSSYYLGYSTASSKMEEQRKLRYEEEKQNFITFLLEQIMDRVFMEVERNNPFFPSTSSSSQRSLPSSAAASSSNIIEELSRDNNNNNTSAHNMYSNVVDWEKAPLVGSASMAVISTTAAPSSYPSDFDSSSTSTNNLGDNISSSQMDSTNGNIEKRKSEDLNSTSSSSSSSASQQHQQFNPTTGSPKMNQFEAPMATQYGTSVMMMHHRQDLSESTTSSDEDDERDDHRHHVSTSFPSSSSALQLVSGIRGNASSYNSGPLLFVGKETSDQQTLSSSASSSSFLSGTTSSRKQDAKHGSEERDFDSPPAWIPDSWSRNCFSCKRAFTPVYRKHHCRHCGHIFCGKCTSKKACIPKFAYLKAVRVCDACYGKITAANNNNTNNNSNSHVVSYSSPSSPVSRSSTQQLSRTSVMLPSIESFSSSLGVRGSPPLSTPSVNILSEQEKLESVERKSKTATSPRTEEQRRREAELRQQRQEKREADFRRQRKEQEEAAKRLNKELEVTVVPKTTSSSVSSLE
ncbi:Carrier protein, mitochondrial [Balamuthia mandrillaris]